MALRTSLLLTTVLSLGTVRPAHILMMTLGGTRSHKVPFLALGQGLVTRGHRVTLVSAFPPATSARGQVEELNPLGLVQFVRNFTDWDLIGPKLRGEEPVPIFNVLKYTYQVCDAFYSAPETRRLLVYQPSLLVLDGAFPECLLGLAHHFGAPFVYLNTVAFYTAELAMAGNPSMFSVTPYLESPHSDRMNFWERSMNAAFHLLSRGVLLVATKFMVEPVVRQHLGSSVPPLHSIGSNVSLILQNGHHSVTYPRPFLPGVVEVACMHCTAAKPLPHDLESFISGGKKSGFIYVSFGTSVNTAHMPEVLRVLMMRVFSELPYPVLWQHQLGQQSADDLPDNVRLAGWFPQQDLLGHPKILAFVSHGGLHSIIESVYHGVPMVTLPIFCDQEANSFKAEKDGYAIKLNVKDLSEKKLFAAISKVVSDKRYKKNAEQRSQLLKDQPEPPLDRALYWLDYVLRHQGAPHLQSPAKDLTFVQYFMLDTLGALMALLYITSHVIRALWAKTFSKGRKYVKVKTK